MVRFQKLTRNSPHIMQPECSFCVHKIPPPASVLSQISSVPPRPHSPCSLNIRFNFYPSMPRPCQVAFFLRFPETLYAFVLSALVPHVIHISLSLTCNVWWDCNMEPNMQSLPFLALSLHSFALIPFLASISETPSSRFPSASNLERWKTAVYVTLFQARFIVNV
jgi:hypothetical protein